MKPVWYLQMKDDIWASFLLNVNKVENNECRSSIYYYANSFGNYLEIIYNYVEFILGLKKTWKELKFSFVAVI